MKTGNMAKLGLCFALVFALSFTIGGWSWAQEGICILPSGTGEVTYSSGWGDSVLAVYTSDDKVSRGNYIEVRVDSDKHGCAPYQWEVSGRGFHFDGISGPGVTTTDGDWQALQLWADSTACGSAFITVKDGCGSGAGTSVRELISGRWVLVEEEDCSGANYLPGNCWCSCGGTVILGAYRYYSEWIGGTNMHIQYTGPLCESYPEVPFSAVGKPVCGCAGFEPWFAVSEQRPGVKRKWRWDCP
jgi:hypothetical protein